MITDDRLIAETANRLSNESMRLIADHAPNNATAFSAALMTLCKVIVLHSRDDGMRHRLMKLALSYIPGGCDAVLRDLAAVSQEGATTAPVDTTDNT